MISVAEARSITLCSRKPFAPLFHRHIVKAKLNGRTCRVGDRAVIYDIVATEPAGTVQVTSATRFHFKQSSEPTESPVIAKNVSRVYSNNRGVRDVSLSIQTGQCLGILGGNGSGKTTLTRLVAGFDRPQSGSLLVLGDNAYSRASELRRRCGVALDTASHWESLSGRQNLWFFARQYGLDGKLLKQRMDELLFAAGLSDQADEPVGDYSFGMRRKLSILEALCHDPDLLILDEPSAGIDVAFVEKLSKLIRNRSEQGKTTWIADNNADWLSKVATHAVLLCDGRIRARGGVHELMESVGLRNRIDIVLEHGDFCGSPNIEGLTGFRSEANRLTMEVNADQVMPSVVLDWITSTGGSVRSMEVRSVTLYEALIQRAGLQEARV